MPRYIALGTTTALLIFSCGGGCPDKLSVQSIRISVIDGATRVPLMPTTLAVTKDGIDQHAQCTNPPMCDKWATGEVSGAIRIEASIGPRRAVADATVTKGTYGDNGCDHAIPIDVVLEIPPS